MSPFMYYAMPFVISFYIVSICHIVFVKNKGIRNLYANMNKIVTEYENYANHPVNPIIRILTIVFLITMTLLFSPFLVMLG
jgi:hypothetical protein